MYFGHSGSSKYTGITHFSTYHDYFVELAPDCARSPAPSILRLLLRPLLHPLLHSHAYTIQKSSPTQETKTVVLPEATVLIVRPRFNPLLTLLPSTSKSPGATYTNPFIIWTDSQVSNNDPLTTIGCAFRLRPGIGERITTPATILATDSLYHLDDPPLLRYNCFEWTLRSSSPLPPGPPGYDYGNAKTSNPTPNLPSFCRYPIPTHGCIQLYDLPPSSNHLS